MRTRGRRRRRRRIKSPPARCATRALGRRRRCLTTSGTSGTARTFTIASAAAGPSRAAGIPGVLQAWALYSVRARADHPVPSGPSFAIAECVLRHISSFVQSIVFCPRCVVCEWNGGRGAHGGALCNALAAVWRQAGRLGALTHPATTAQPQLGSNYATRLPQTPRLSSGRVRPRAAGLPSRSCPGPRTRPMPRSRSATATARCGIAHAPLLFPHPLNVNLTSKLLLLLHHRCSKKS